ncbi:MAG: DNA/RNA nuclease SfsA [Thermoplasmatota archaeon]
MSELKVPVKWDIKARFVSRPNRFLAMVEMGENGRSVVKAHVHDPGRLKEVLFPGNEVLLRRADSRVRKTRWDVIAGKVGDTWVLVNSSFHRPISSATLMDIDIAPFGKLSSLRPEVKVGKSRLDYLAIDENGQELYIEVKGCSLTRDGIALFPDAPTTRGTRHIWELIEIARTGKRAGIMVIVLGPKAECFMPNFETDPDFARAFKEAVDAGVEIRPISFELVEDHLLFRGEVPLCYGISRS